MKQHLHAPTGVKGKRHSLKRFWTCTNREKSFPALIVPARLLVCSRAQNSFCNWCMSEIFCDNSEQHPGSNLPIENVWLVKARAHAHADGLFILAVCEEGDAGGLERWRQSYQRTNMYNVMRPACVWPGTIESTTACPWLVAYMHACSKVSCTCPHLHASQWIGMTMPLQD